MTQELEDLSVTLLREQAREHDIPEEKAVKAWEEMKAKYGLPPYVEPTLETWSESVVLVPAVNINLLSRLDKDVPGWEKISTELKR